MSFAEWQTSRGIVPWTSMPQHRAAAVRRLLDRLRAGWGALAALLRRVVTAAYDALRDVFQNFARAVAAIRLPPLVSV